MQTKVRVVLKRVTTSYQVDCIGQPGKQQRNTDERKNPSMKSQLWNPGTYSKVGTED